MKVDARELRALHEQGVPLAQLSQRFRLSLPLVYEAILTAKAVAEPVRQTPQTQGPFTVLSTGAVAVARETVSEGRGTVAEIAVNLGLPHSTVYAAVYGLTWRSVTNPPPLPRPSATPPVNASLTVRDVAEARRLYAAGGPSIRDLALRFGVGDSTIRSAIHGLSWVMVTDPPPVPIAATSGRRYIPDEDVELIVELRAQGATWGEIGERVGVHKSSALRAYRRAKKAGPRP
ncbi:hypothetical protein [Streptomyces sp. NPDC095613]|uniref:hypothetical protein n=1 Tax=Streptomyces sp. NPDC095613 TaxID=3155540 RepID=UPI0033304B14